IVPPIVPSAKSLPCAQTFLDSSRYYPLEKIPTFTVAMVNGHKYYFSLVRNNAHWVSPPQRSPGERLSALLGIPAGDESCIGRPFPNADRPNSAARISPNRASRRTRGTRCALWGYHLDNRL